MAPTGEGAEQPPTLRCCVHPTASLGCNIWLLPGAWISGALPGYGAVWWEHDPGASGRGLLPKDECEMLEGAWVWQRMKSSIEFKGLSYIYLHYSSEE